MFWVRHISAGPPDIGVIIMSIWLIKVINVGASCVIKVANGVRCV